MIYKDKVLTVDRIKTVLYAIDDMGVDELKDLMKQVIASLVSINEQKLTLEKFILVSKQHGKLIMPTFFNTLESLRIESRYLESTIKILKTCIQIQAKAGKRNDKSTGRSE